MSIETRANDLQCKRKKIVDLKIIHLGFLDPDECASGQIKHEQHTRLGKHIDKECAVQTQLKGMPIITKVIVLKTLMEELPSGLKLGGVTFIAQHGSSSYTDGNLENMCWTGHHKHLTRSKRVPFGSYNQSSEIPNSSADAMEFLCRSWSPTASDFLHALSPHNLLLHPSVNDKIEEHEEEQQVEEELKNTAQSNGAIANMGDTIRMDLTGMKGWLKGKSLTSFLRSRREKKKEEVRFHTAKLHVALSLTRLAAAIASFATNGSVEAQGINNGGTAAWNHDMGVAVSSAAALVTTVWAEAAESLGAHRAQVASAINSGLAIQTPIDMIALTATAATCLRGAGTLESRALTDSCFPRSQAMLKVGAQICLITPSGHKEYRWVTIHLKHKELILSFRKKYLGGALTTAKEYKAINIIEETKISQGYCFLSLKTNKGIIKLLFEDEKQSNIWISTISNLLKSHNPY